MFILRLSLLLYLLLAVASTSRAGFQAVRSRGTHPSVEKRGAGGWNSVQYPAGAVEASIPVQNGRLELFAMSKGGLDKTKLKRVVFVIHGQGRDPWNYYNHVTNALKQAKTDGLVSSINQVGVWSAGFWCNADEGVWPASETRARKRAGSSKQMVWHNSDWSNGEGSIYPASDKGISSFTALDDVIRYFGNKAIFPNLDTIVLAGHSMGGQMLHRYAQLGKQPLVVPEVHYYIANPASWLYLDNRRPNKGIGGALSRSKCPTYNDYKYGLEEPADVQDYHSTGLDMQSTLNRYKNRFVHYQLGTSDFASATDACEALVQGDSHYSRGRIYQAYLELLGYPARHTIDYIRGIGHDAAAMFASKHGMYRLFVQNSQLGKTEASAMKNGVSDGLKVTFTG